MFAERQFWAIHRECETKSESLLRDFVNDCFAIEILQASSGSSRLF